MFCQSCGKEIKDGSKFCIFCGATIKKKQIEGKTSENSSSIQKSKTELINKIKDNKNLILVATGIVIGLVIVLIVISNILLSNNNYISNNNSSFPEHNRKIKNDFSYNDSKKAYYDSNGDLVKGWFNIGDNYYYSDEGGAVLVNDWIKDGADYYYVDGDGVMQKSTWIEDNKTNPTIWYYAGNDGKLLKGIQNLNNSTYFFDDQGAMKKNYWLTLNGSMFYFGDDGIMKKNEWVDAGDGKYFFVDLNGIMAINKRLSIDGVFYTFGADGIARTDTNVSERVKLMQEFLNAINNNESITINDYNGKYSTLFLKKDDLSLNFATAEFDSSNNLWVCSINGTSGGGNSFIEIIDSNSTNKNICYLNNWDGGSAWTDATNHYYKITSKSDYEISESDFENIKNQYIALRGGKKIYEQ